MKNKIIIQYETKFNKSLKKLFKTKILKAKVLDIIDLIKVNPDAGIMKGSDLKGVRVYAFKERKVDYRLAYIWCNDIIIFIDVNTHENFYNKLHNYIYSKKSLMSLMKEGL
jgi:addiction module RelE/StbE family toxin